jgi:predicted lactoylglutathione lyase
MAGIIFIRTQNLSEVTDFYKKLGATLWVQQPDINILKHGNMLFGFHQQPEASKDVLLTFFYKEKRHVDEMYQEYKERALSQPKENMKYKIYNFFATDPEDRKIEFQTFLHPIEYDWN